jgi:hypothetical protein
MAKSFPHDDAAQLAGQLFGLILDREADKAGYDYVLDCLQSGTKPVRDIVLEFISSDEFITRFVIDSTPAAAVALIHALLLGEKPDDGMEPMEACRQFIRLGLQRYAQGILMSEDYERDVGPDRVPPYGH